MKIHVRLIVGLSFLALFASTAGVSLGIQEGKRDGQGGVIMMFSKDVEWKEGSASLPKGARWAVIEGNPLKEEPYTMRFKLPAHYKVPPHIHPVLEHVTVLSGNLGIGLGKVFDSSQGKVLPAGGFAVMPVGQPHFAWTEEGETIVQLHGTGPWGITYINPEDDPRKSAK